MRVGGVLEKNLTELVKLRNEAAKTLGFKNYHALQLFLNEQNGDDLIKLFDQLDELTRGPFETGKKEFDAILAGHYGIPVAELQPWHYHDPFFQGMPKESLLPRTVLSLAQVLIEKTRITAFEG